MFRIGGFTWGVLGVGLSLSGCILVDEVSESLETDTVVFAQSFLTACRDGGYDRGFGCALACAASGGDQLGLGARLTDFVGSGVGHAPAGGGEAVTRGEAVWSACTFGGRGMVCTLERADYQVQCEAAALSVSYGTRVNRVPAEVVLGSALPDLMGGALTGESTSCLSTCITSLSRPGCFGCRPTETCFESDFGPVCQARGLVASGGPCERAAACQFLVCNVNEGRCGGGAL